MILLIAFATLLLQSFAQTTPPPAAPAGPIADVSGPGQSVDQPTSQCPRAIGCQYAEQTLPPNGYRLQSLQVCGANCTTQYWVSNSTDGHQVLAVDPVRGGGVLAVAAGDGQDPHPQVRVVLPNFAATDPLCCPSSFVDTTYSWDAGSNTLVGGYAAATDAADFPGWDAVRQELRVEGWIVGNV